MRPILAATRPADTGLRESIVSPASSRCFTCAPPAVVQPEEKTSADLAHAFCVLPYMGALIRGVPQERPARVRNGLFHGVPACDRARSVCALLGILPALPGEEQLAELTTGRLSTG